MNATAALARATMLALSVGATGAATAQDVKTVDDYSCKDIMRAGGEDRDLAITFLHGYLVGKSGSASFRPDDLARATDRFIEHCLDNPGDTAVKALAASKG